MKATALILSFFIEVAAFVSTGFSGFIFDVEFFVQVGISLVALITLTIFWATFMSPKAKKPLGRTNYYLSKLVIYGIAAVIIYVLYAKLALLFAVVALISELLLIRHNTSRLK